MTSIACLLGSLHLHTFHLAHTSSMMLNKPLKKCCVASLDLIIWVYIISPWLEEINTFATIVCFNIQQIMLFIGKCVRSRTLNSTML